MIVILQEDFKSLTHYVNLCISAGIEENEIVKTVEKTGIEHCFETNEPVKLIISAKMYDFYIASLVEKKKNISIILSDIGNAKTTIRLLLSKQFKHVNVNTSIFEMKNILFPSNQNKEISYMTKQKQISSDEIMELAISTPDFKKFYKN